MNTQYVIAFDLSYPENYKDNHIFTGYLGTDDSDGYIVGSCSLVDCKKFKSMGEAEKFFNNEKERLMSHSWFRLANPRIYSIEVKNVKSLGY